MHTPTLTWQDDALVIVDQTRLPTEKVLVRLTSADDVFPRNSEYAGAWRPRHRHRRGFRHLLGRARRRHGRPAGVLATVDVVANRLVSARPTAVNLAWAVERQRRTLSRHPQASVPELKQLLLAEAQSMIQEDNAVCLAIGRHGADLLRPGMGIFTHCNAGGLGTARYGTALAPIYVAKARGIDVHVYADETRPVLQGARLTAWELKEAGVPVTLICDNMAAVVMQRGWVQAVIVGTDRVARNGDVANKIGTYGLAVLAKAHSIPFYVAAPRSSIDLAIASGAEIPIEERDPREVTEGMGRKIATRRRARVQPRLRCDAG